MMLARPLCFQSGTMRMSSSTDLEIIEMELQDLRLLAIGFDLGP